MQGDKETEIEIESSLKHTLKRISVTLYISFSQKSDTVLFNSYLHSKTKPNLDDIECKPIYSGSRLIRYKFWAS